MIEAARLLSDLKRFRRVLDADLREAHTTGPARDAVRAEWQDAFDSGRTRETFETFFDAALDQAGVHWVLAGVFLRFLEDNRLIDPPVIGGPGDRLEQARERHAAYFRGEPHDSDLDWLLAKFADAARLPGVSGLFDPLHNPLFRLPVSGDGAIRLREFFQAVVPETGAPAHDFTDPEWDTRFLGDLYQHLSEEARKRYALLQTPAFVGSWILDRTLEPALREFGFREMRMIDPTCGSGHFLLDGFSRVLREWQTHEPGMAPPAQAQRALDAVAGVDLNPFSVEIARFRLLLAALRAAGVERLKDAPDFRINLGIGDSLLHGTHFSRQELGGGAEGFGRVLRHHYVNEDTKEINRILNQQYHAVVGNPPYITPKDAAMRDAYREIYASCHGAYGLGVPFIERFFDLAQAGTRKQAAGFVGLIVANSFMKREFGKKLIEDVLPHLDLTHLVDCSGAYIPGHGTPTVILFGRNRAPIGTEVRAVMGIRGEPATPADPAHGLVWSAILAQTDKVGSVSDFASVAALPRATLARHPWSIGGGGASELKATIESNFGEHLTDRIDEIGFGAVTREDDAYLMSASAARRLGIANRFVRPMVEGEDVRDFRIVSESYAIWPYDDVSLESLGSDPVEHLLWPMRSRLKQRVAYGQTQLQRGLRWFEYSMFFRNRFHTPLTITFAFVATHNHFVLDRGGKAFNRSAPMIKLPVGASEEDHLGLLGLLNSSTACFWLKSISHNKGATVDDRGARQRSDPFEDFYEFTGTGLQKYPIASRLPVELARALDAEAQRLSTNLPVAVAVAARATPTRATLDAARTEAEAARAHMIALQEELDWHCYRLYGVLDDAVEHTNPPPLRLGDRAFEIVLAGRMEAGELETAWFERHRSTPIAELPAHWPADYRNVIERRICLIETDPNIGLLERPEYKRRWSMAPWEEMEKDALRDWLLNRIEEPGLWPTPAELLTTNQLADRVRRDADFMSVALLYRGREDFDHEVLVAELVGQASVPFLAALRYAETGLRKRAQWENTWRLQRQEDAIEAEVAAARPTLLHKSESKIRERWRAINPRRDDETPETYAERMAKAIARTEIEEEADRGVVAEQRRRKMEEVGDIPVPPKYVSKDFQNQDYWRLRGGLDVPKERFVSFPNCSLQADGSLLVTWAGHNHLARAMAIGTFYQARKDKDGWPVERLVPLLAGLQELLPSLLQWYNGADEGGMGDYFSEFIRDEARALGLTEEAVAAWTPPARAARGRRRANA
jgi:hypothetical protein